MRWSCDRNETVADLHLGPRLKGIDLNEEYIGSMLRDALTVLAAGRRRRLQGAARPMFDLTAEEVERSTRAAMRLADASKSQAEARVNANNNLPA